MADNFFSLDIGERFTKVVEAKKNGDKLEISALAKTETLSNFFSTDLEKNISEQASSISKMLGSLKINKKNVNVVIPGTFTYSQILTMPLLNEKELISAIKYQADQFIPMPIEETNIDLEIIEEFKEEKKILILIVAAPKRLIEKIQSTVELAGLIPETIENELSASSRFFSTFGKNLIPAGGGGAIVANFGLNSTTLSYFEPVNYNMQANHNFAVGYQLFLKEIQINTDTDQKKAEQILLSFDMKNKSSYPVDVIAQPLLKEFTSELKRFASGKKISAIYLFNQIFIFPSLAEFVSNDMGIATYQLNPYPFTINTPLVESFKNELSVYVSGLGGNLR